jgi:TIR domain-containing protein
LPGINVFAHYKQGQVRGVVAGVRLQECVFISHKREDAGMARAVADSLTDFDIDVWLDLDELGFPEPTSKQEHVRLTLAIEAGLNASSHLLALITKNTTGSWWVPFEIGTCRAKKKPLAFLLHKEVRDIPSYFSVGAGLETKHDFYDWAKALSSRKSDIENRAAIATLSTSPLDQYVDLILKR